MDNDTGNGEERTVRVRHERPGGRDRYYPVNHTAELMRQMTGWKTIPEDKFPLIEQLGFTIEIQEGVRKNAA